MNISSQTHKIELFLKKRELVSIDDVQPHMAIECRQGVIWVTRAGERQDYTLRAGRHFIPKGEGRLVIEAIDDARVDIEG